MMAFELWPAIDLMEGEPVRLVRGERKNKILYQFELSELAERFSRFATGIHVVDLDGAFSSGDLKQLDSIRQICEASSVPVEVGGGIRSFKEIRDLLKIGVKRVILGTIVIENVDFLPNALNEFGTDQIVIGADIKNGYLATHGWKGSSSVTIDELFQRLQTISEIRTVIITDISRDGTLKGPTEKLYQELHKAYNRDFTIIASGGVGNMGHIRHLRKIGVSGVVFGKALLDGKITDEELTRFSHEQC